MKFVRAVQAKYDPDVAIRVLTYVHIASKIDPRAPFFTADEKEVRDLAMMNIFTPAERKIYKHEEFEDYKKWYEKENETPELRMVKIFNDKIDQIREMIKSTKPQVVSVNKQNVKEGKIGGKKTASRLEAKQMTVK